MKNDQDMSPEDWRLRELLAAPRAPADLRTRIEASIDSAAASAPRRDLRAFVVFGVAATMIIAITATFWMSAAPTPGIVIAAYQDMLKERGLRGVFDGNDAPPLIAGHIGKSLGVSVELSKKCNLNGVGAKHLRVVNAELGRVNVFVYTAATADLRQVAVHGELEDQQWLLLEPRPGLAVVVLYEDERRRELVQQLVARMFPGDKAAHFRHTPESVESVSVGERSRPRISA